MFTLVSGLYDLYTRKDEYFIIILGLDNAGKTTLLERVKATYTHSRGLVPEKIGPTIGLNIGKIEVGRVRLNFWDLGGQRELRMLWSKYYSDSHAIMFVVDSADPDRIEEAKAAFEDVITAHELEGVPLLMLANKMDKPGAISSAGMKHLFSDLALRLGARDSKVMAVSALRGEGIRDAIDWLFLRLERNKGNRPPSYIFMLAKPIAPQEVLQIVPSIEAMASYINSPLCKSTYTLCWRERHPGLPAVYCDHQT